MEIQTSKEGSKGNFEKPKIVEGIYNAKLKEVKNISDGQYGQRVAFIYSVNVNETSTVELSFVSYIPEVATPENKFGKVLLAHGVDLGGKVDTSALKGTEVRVSVEDYNFEEDGVTKTASTIDKVKPLAETVTPGQ